MDIRSLLNNNEGVLTGIGIVLSLILALIGGQKVIKMITSKMQKQKIKTKGNENKTYQAGRDVFVNEQKQTKKEENSSAFGLVKGKSDKIEINGVLWEWYWRKNSDRRDKNFDILDLKPLCPKHKYQLKYMFDGDDILGEQWPIGLFCRECKAIVGDYGDIFHDCENVPEFEDEIRRLILSRTRR